MEFLYDYGLFFLKTLTLVIAMAIIVGIVVSASMRTGEDKNGLIEVNKLNDRFDAMRQSLANVIYPSDTLKKREKAQAKEKKQAQAKEKKHAKASSLPDDTAPKRVYLIDFHGDMRASEVKQLRECVSTILFTARQQDEVVVRLESPGGVVHGYGLAASQLHRLRQREIPLTVCVDKVAASGGYMMACVADKICAAPFAIIGSIGVLAQLPNFNKLLKKNDIEFEQLTAGEYKRTLTLFGENTDKARQKFMQDLTQTHELFKQHVKTLRPTVDVESIATGEIWFGSQAQDKQLVDQLTTSDDYLTQLAAHHDVFHVTYHEKKTLPEKLGISLQQGMQRGIEALLDKLSHQRFL